MTDETERRTKEIKISQLFRDNLLKIRENFLEKINQSILLTEVCG